MELTCPHCAAHYRVPADAVPPQGREVHCAKCGQSWFEAGPADPGDPLAHDTPLGEGVSDFGVVEVPAMPLGPAVAIPPAMAPLEPQPVHAWDVPERSRTGLGTIGWILLLLVLALIAAGAYAYLTGLLKLPA